MNKSGNIGEGSRGIRHAACTSLRPEKLNWIKAGLLQNGEDGVAL
jgi:hypothetical protein